MDATNPYCKALGIEIPSLEMASVSGEANYYSLLIVALLERGGPITLEDAAQRFEAAGIAPANEALASLKRCKPARPPIYRDGDLYALDPHDDEVDLWAFRLGLRPPKVARTLAARAEPGPLPSPNEPLTVAALDEAWREGVSAGWSALRIAICVLDAHGGRMRAADVLAFVRARARWSLLSATSAQHWRRGSAVQVHDDGSWALDQAHAALASARQAVRERIVAVRRWAQVRPDPAVIEANQRRFEAERAANAERLARMRRVVIHAFPTQEPVAVVLADVDQRQVVTLLDEEIATVSQRLADYDVIAAMDVRALLRALAFEPGEHRLAELGPPQKTVQLNRRGRTLRITTALLIQGTCGISRPLADETALRRYRHNHEQSKLRRRLEADTKSLVALYQYGRLHGTVRLRWGFLDELIPAPWVHRDERTLYNLMTCAHQNDAPLEVVVGTAPGWGDPWRRVQPAYVQKQDPGWRLYLVDARGHPIDVRDVQLARLVGTDTQEAGDERRTVSRSGVDYIRKSPPDCLPTANASFMYDRDHLSGCGRP